MLFETCFQLTHELDEIKLIDAFELWCWRRLLRVPWTARRSNQSIPKEINPEYSLEGLMLRLKLDKPRQCIKKQRNHFADKGLYSRSSGFPSCYVQMWEFDYKADWASKIWCFQIVVLEKTVESPLHCKGVKSVNPKGNQSQIIIGRTVAEVEALILWLPDVKSQLTEKVPDAGKDWGQEEEGLTEDEMVGWHHRLNGHEFEQTPGDSERQGSLVLCSPWSHKESEIT